MDKRKTAPTRKRNYKKKSKQSNLKFWTRWSRNQKIAALFVVVFAVIGGVFLIKSYAAAGDELQAKDNTTWNFAIARRVVLSPDGSFGYTLDGYGALHPFHTYGAQPKSPSGVTYFPGHDIARDVIVTNWDPSNPKGYVLDGWGGIHPFGGAKPVSGADYWNGWDIARRIVTVRGGGGYVLDGWGGLHPFAFEGGTKPPNVKQGPYWPGQDIARDITLRSDGAFGLILTCNGGLTPVGFGTNNAAAYPNGFPYNKDRCDFQSIVNYEWTKPSGVVISAKGEFAGYGTWYVKPFITSGLGKVVDGQCKRVTAEAATRCWAMDDHGGIRAFSEPNAPLFTDKEQAYFAAVKKAQEQAAAQAAADAAAKAAADVARRAGGSTTTQNICAASQSIINTDIGILSNYDVTYARIKRNYVGPYFWNVVDQKRQDAWAAVFALNNWSQNNCRTMTNAQYSQFLVYVADATNKIRGYSVQLDPLLRWS